MTIREFVEAYKAKKFMNTQKGVEERTEWIRQELEIQTYIPFKTKREIAEMIVAAYTKEIDGVKKHDSISAYVGLVTASIAVHTNLQFGEDPIEDYDVLAENGLLTQIVALFQESHSEIDILLKMALAAELEDNNIHVSVGHVLNKVSKVLDVISNKIENLDLQNLLGMDINKEDLAKLSGFLNKNK